MQQGVGALEKLFGSSSRVKIMRLFLLNPETLFTVKEISRRAKVALPSARREILLFKNIDFIKQKQETLDEIIKLKNGKIKNKKKKNYGWKLNQLFSFLHPLKRLVLNAAPVDKETLTKLLRSAGRMQLAVLSGIFIQSDDSRVDILLVGDSLNKASVERILRNIEAVVGKELVYAIFSTKEFLYRFGMYDKFVRDVLDYPHEKLINKLNV